MLTRSDRTVEDAADQLQTALSLGVRHIGFQGHRAADRAAQGPERGDQGWRGHPLSRSRLARPGQRDRIGPGGARDRRRRAAWWHPGGRRPARDRRLPHPVLPLSRPDRRPSQRPSKAASPRSSRAPGRSPPMTACTGSICWPIASRGTCPALMQAVCAAVDQACLHRRLDRHARTHRHRQAGRGGRLHHRHRGAGGEIPGRRRLGAGPTRRHHPRRRAAEQSPLALQQEEPRGLLRGSADGR